MKISADWLTERVENAPTSYHRTLSPMTALRIRMAWQKLRRATTEGDELWAFSSPPNTWKKQGRYAGYAIVREGRILQTTVVTQE